MVNFFRTMLCSLILMCGCTTGRYLVYTKRYVEPLIGACRAYKLIAALGDDAILLGSAPDGWLVIECELEKLKLQPNVLKIKPLGEELVSQADILILYRRDADRIKFPDGVKVESFYPLGHMVLLRVINGVSGALAKKLEKLKWAVCIEPNWPFEPH